jgi:hypothetical protein
MTAATSQPVTAEYTYTGTHPEDTEQSALEVQRLIIHLTHSASVRACILCRPVTSERTRRYDR